MKIRRIIYFALFAVALLIVLGVIDVMIMTTPEQLRARISEEIAEQLNADFEVDSIEHSTFSSKVVLTNLRLKGRGQDSRVFFTANKVTLSLNYFAFLGRPGLKSAVFEDPLLTIYKPKETATGRPGATPIENLATSGKRTSMPKMVFRNATLHVYTDETTMAEITGLNLVVDPAGSGEKNSLTFQYTYAHDGGGKQLQMNVTMDPVTRITHVATSGGLPNYLCLTDDLRDVLAKLAAGGNAFAADFLNEWDDLGLGGTLRIESFDFTYDPSKDQPEQNTYSGRFIIEDGMLAVAEFPYRVRLVGGEVDVDEVNLVLKGVRGVNDRGGNSIAEGNGAIKNFLSSQSEVNIDVATTNMPIDDKLRAALSQYPDIMKIWADIQPTGASKTALIKIRKTSEMRMCSTSVAIHFDGHAGGSYAYTDTDGATGTVEVDGITGDIDFSEGGAKINAAGRVAGVGVRIADGWIARPGYPDSEMAIEAATDAFELNDSINAALPADTRKEIAGITGKMSLKLRLNKQKDQPKPTFGAEIVVDNASILNNLFPYQFDKVEGTLLYKENRIQTPPDKAITATHGDAKFVMKLSIDTSTPQKQYDVEIHGEKVPLDKALYDALPEEVRKEVDNYIPADILAAGAGVADVVCRIKGSGPKPDVSVEMHVTGGTLKCAYFPYVVKDVSGVMKIEPGGVYLDQVRGTHGGAQLSLDGGKIEKDAVDLTVNGKAVVFDEDLRAALREDLAKAYDSFKPSGSVDVAAHLTSKNGEPLRPEVTIVSHKTMEFTYAGFPLPAKEVEAEAKITPDNIMISKFGCKFGGLVIPYDEQKNHCEISPGKDTQFRLNLGEIENVLINDELKAALPKGLSDALTRMALKGGMDLANVELDFLIGENRARYSCKFDATLKDCSLGEKKVLDKLNGRLKFSLVENPGEQASMEGTSFEDLEFFIRGLHITKLGGKFTRLDAKDVDFTKAADPHRVDFTAFFYDTGEKANIKDGYFIFNLGDSTEYKGGFTFDSVNLNALHTELTQKESKLSGKMDGRVDFRGEGEDFSNLQGNGTLNIAEGNLGDLPFFTRLNALLKIEAPEKQYIKEGSVKFDIKDKAINFEEMQFHSQTGAVNYTGYGKVDFDDNLDVIIFSDSVLQIPVVEQIFSWFKRQLYPVQITGSFAEPKAGSAVFNAITDIPEGVRKLLGGD